MKKLNKKAFTLIELLVVIAVIGILVLFGAPRFTGYTQRAELTRIQHDIKVMEQEVGTVLINKDDDFNKWEDNNKDLNQLAQDNKLFEKEGPVAKEVEPIDEAYKVIPEKYKDKINTKLKGTFYANSGGKVYYEHLKPLSGIPTEPGEKEPGVPVDPEKPTEPGEKEPGVPVDPEKPAEPVEEEPGEKEPVLEGPIPIATAEELNNVRNAAIERYGVGTQWEGLYEGGLDKQYFQVADIDLSKYSEEEGWNPIGTRLTTISKAPFTGTYDGRNYVIRGLEVKGAGKDYQGLFGITHGATISNVDLIDNKVTGNRYVGSLVGQADLNTKISNSHATGEVKGSDYYVGGLVGWADKNIIEDSYATGPVTGGRYVGGLVGWDSSSTIENSYAIGSVESLGNSVGGLVGSTYNSNISNSYAAGSATGRQFVGGLVGRAQKGMISKSYAKGSVTGTGEWVGGLAGEARDSTIENSYATGAVETSNSYGYVGGLVGYTNSVIIKNSYATGSVTITVTVSDAFKVHQREGGLVGSAYETNIENSYWDTTTTGQEKSAGGEGNAGEGKSTKEMKEADTYSAWNTDVWKIDDGKGYPKLR